MADELSISVSVKDPEFVECGECSFLAFTLMFDEKEMDTCIIPLEALEDYE